jgi:hypothetical protein
MLWILVAVAVVAVIGLWVCYEMGLFASDYAKSYFFDGKKLTKTLWYNDGRWGEQDEGSGLSVDAHSSP